MTEKKKPSDTMRIDLIPERQVSAEAEPKGPLASFTRMNWMPPKRTLHFVAHSQYKELLQSLYDATLITNLEGEIVDVNTRAEEFLLHPADELKGMSVLDLIHGADEALLDRIRDNVERERHCLIEAYCLRKDESTFAAEIAVSKIRLENVCLCFFLRDISLRLQTEEMLRLEHNALQIAGNGIVIADVDLLIEYANPAFAGMVGWERAEELQGRNMMAFFDDTVAAENLMRLVNENRGNSTRELRMKTRGGSEVFGQVSACANRNADGVCQGLVFSVMDVTERKRLHERLERTVADQTTEYRRSTEKLQRQIADLQDAARENADSRPQG